MMGAFRHLDDPNFDVDAMTGARQRPVSYTHLTLPTILRV